MWLNFAINMVTEVVFGGLFELIHAFDQQSLRGQGYLGIRSWKLSLSTYLIEGVMVVI